MQRLAEPQEIASYARIAAVLSICDDGHPHVIGLPSSHGQPLTLPVSVELEMLQLARAHTA
jgi:hypothetical protein